MTRCFLAIVLTAALVIPALGFDDDLGIALEEGENDELASGARFQFVSVHDPDADLGAQLFWRTNGRVVAASATFERLRVDGQDVIVPHTKVGKFPWRNATAYPYSGRHPIGEGQHRIRPGDMRYKVDAGKLTCQHPALRWDDDDHAMQILCAPVRFEHVDSRGRSVPGPVHLHMDSKGLMRKSPKFNPLIAWLPVGHTYLSNFGKFAISAKGDVEALDLKSQIQLYGNTLSWVVKTAPKPESSGLFHMRRWGDPTAGQIGFYAQPLTAPGQPFHVAVDQADLSRHIEAPQKTALTAELSNARFGLPGAATLNIRPQYKGRLLAGAPNEALASDAGQAIGEGRKLLWYALELPPHSFGTVFMRVDVAGFNVRVPVVVANASEPIHLIPHRGRLAYGTSEQAPIHVVIAKAITANTGEIWARLAGNESAVKLGTLPLPTGQADARTFYLSMGDLPLGNHKLWLQAGDTRSGELPLTVVPWRVRSPFLVHSMSCCTGLWPSDPEGLAVMRDLGFDMLTSASGHGSTIGVQMPELEPATATALGLPEELGLNRKYNDIVYDNFLRNGIRQIDNTVLRSRGFYMESLAYHHSYQPNVDRMVRRMQLFTQQTADYPSFYGTNFAWFPQLRGYVENGVDTDTHRADRNKALDAAVAAAGFPGEGYGLDIGNVDKLSKHQRWRKYRKLYQSYKSSGDPAKMKKAIAYMQRSIGQWSTEQALGFGRHNQLYTDAIREVRPETVTTLFENAGHDGAAKRTRDLFNGMVGACYMSYTDFGEWPMSAGYTTDWARAELPGRPVWLTVDWGASDDSMPKSLMHAFARGVDGGGFPMQADKGWSILKRRGQAIKFFQQFGGLCESATPDQRVAILSTLGQKVMSRRAYYTYHAMYYHLTRLGYPPVLLPEERAWKDGIPPHVQVLVLVRQEHPFDGQTRELLAKFVADGGKLLQTSDSQFKVDGAVTVDGKLKNIWELSGFHKDSHKALWKAFTDTWREPLSTALQDVSAFAKADPDKGLALGMEAGPIRYVALLSDAKDTFSVDIKPFAKFDVSLEGTGWQVRDLVNQRNLAAQADGERTKLIADLSDSPAVLLALYKSPPKTVEISSQNIFSPGNTYRFSSVVKDKNGDSMGMVPVRYQWLRPDGSVRETFYGSATTSQSWYVPRFATSGTWQLQVTELLTGKMLSSKLTFAPSPESNSVTPVPDVHVLNEAHVRKFVARKEAEPIAVMLEAGQQQLQPIAEWLVAELNKSGAKARLWRVAPEQFDTVPTRWYPREEDRQRAALIDAGKLIGLRKSMKAYVDDKTRQHIPDRGGYVATYPRHVVGSDCILFSGGALAESLRDASPWMDTPNVPGINQARIVVAFSAFKAGKHATALIANDIDGHKKAAKALLERYKTPQQPTHSAPEPLAPKSTPGVAATVDVPTPYANYIPIRRVERLLAAANGDFAVVFNGKKNHLALVNKAGTITRAVRIEKLLPASVTIDDQGRAWHLSSVATAMHPSWGYPIAYKRVLRRIGAAPEDALEMPAFLGSVENLPPNNWEAARIGPDGQTAFLGRRGGALFGPLDEPQRWRWLDDIPYAKVRNEIRSPRWPVGTTFSRNGRFVAFTMDTRPRLGGMGRNQPAPTNCSTFVVDCQSGKPLWSKRLHVEREHRFALSRGFGALANDGTLALLDHTGWAYLIAADGKVLHQELIAPVTRKDLHRRGPQDAVGVAISADGTLAAIAMTSFVYVIQRDADNASGKRLPFAGPTTIDILANGSHITMGLENGKAVMLTPNGDETWSVEPGGVAPLVKASGNNVAVATSNGRLLKYTNGGEVLWSVDLLPAVDGEANPVSPEARPAPTPREYREPNTLSLAKQQLNAKQVAAWRQAGEKAEAYGRTFYRQDTTIHLEGSFRNGFAHVVYRRPKSNESVTVTVTSDDGKEAFHLDLPTPEYRVIALPFRGPNIKVTLTTKGPVDIAEFSLWSYEWPGPNLAWVQPPDQQTDNGDGLMGDDDDELALEDGGSDVSGKMKDCKFYSWNPDPDQISGPWLRVAVPPLAMVDGLRFGNGKLKPMAAPRSSYRGLWWTLQFPQPTHAQLVAYYDRSNKQSDVGVNLSAFTAFEGQPKEERDAGRILSAVIGNDQFWRLLPIPPAQYQDLGVQTYISDHKSEGISEVEIY